MPRILGIDPGKSGALAFLTISEGLPVSLDLIDMPSAQIGQRSQVDAYALAREVDARLMVDGQPIAAAFIEQGGVRPQNGRVGAATFWLGIGVLRGVLAANFVPIETVAAGVWKRSLRLAGDKDASRLRASALFPRWAAQWSRAKDHGRAEAALIALYGANTLPVLEARKTA